MSPDFVINAEYASRFAALALAHVTREYPNKLDHILYDAADVQSPKALHPIFYGSFDWHSCVHGYWLLARVYRTFPDMEQASSIRALFNELVTPENVAAEVAYAAHPGRGGFERPYGWAWVLQLCAEFSLHESADGRRWLETLAPLGAVFRERFIAFLPKATYAIRVGTHFNSAFAVILAKDYADRFADVQLASELRTAALRWFSNDTAAPAWGEPGGDDFLSGTLTEAVCMSRVMPTLDFELWLDAFLPDVATSRPHTLFAPAYVSDRTDGKIAHLDGLNLSRAWCWRLLARHWSEDDPRRIAAVVAAGAHLQTSLPHVAGDYMGEHWLGTFALLAMSS
ncbi:MAG: DUF2891 domain-containing protein [Phycisphaerae bacterium]|nr:DUF2891 domain-containing protein [Gemmatimonadaceae bacterium]